MITLNNYIHRGNSGTSQKAGSKISAFLFSLLNKIANRYGYQIVKTGNKREYKKREFSMETINLQFIIRQKRQSQSKLAKHFGVSEGAISRAIAGEQKFSKLRNDIIKYIQSL